MNKLAKVQAQANAIAKGEDAAMGTVETVILLIGVVFVVAVLFMFLVGKVKGGADGVEQDITAAQSYAGGNITGKSGS